MERSFELEIHMRLAAYLTGEAAIDEFKSWLVAVTWDRDRTQPSSGLQFANEIKLVFAEHSGGFRSDDELRHDLANLLHRTEVEVEPAAP